MRRFIISMSLFAVVVAYVALRLPANKMETVMPAVAAKEETEKTKQLVAAAYRKPKKASEEDWEAVRSIAQEYAKEIGNVVALCEKLKTSEYYGRYGVLKSAQSVTKSTDLFCRRL